MFTCVCLYVVVCLFVCLFVGVCQCKYMYLHVCVHIYVYTCIHAYMYTCLCAGNESFGICADSRVIRSLCEPLQEAAVEGIYQEPLL